MTKQSLVSIIIPTHNRAHLIGETLDSVLSQTYQNWECIVVDDGSTDDTETLLAHYISKDSRIQYHNRPDTHLPGGNGARNYGFEMSTGAYIQWFDSDDLMHPNKLKIKLEYAHQHQADIIVDTHALKPITTLPENPKVTVFTRADFYINFILGEHPVITNDVMVARKTVNTLRFDENLRKAQEFEFFSRLFEQELTYCFINIPLTQYRAAADSISKTAGTGNGLQQESLIYLSKKLQKTHSNNALILARAKRQGRKTYRNLIKSNRVKLVFTHFQFFKNCHNKSSLVFLAFIVYNSLTKRGFDKIKP